MELKSTVEFFFRRIALSIYLVVTRMRRKQSGTTYQSNTSAYKSGESITGWGFIGIEGQSNFQNEVNDDGRRIKLIRRRVEPKHKFVDPFKAGLAIPVDQDREVVVPQWKLVQSIAGQHVYEMPLSIAGDLAFSSLYDLASQLHSTRKEGSGTPRQERDTELLDELTHILDLFLVICDHYLKRECSLGLLDPKNILYYFDEDGELTVVMPDAGFIYMGEKPAAWMRKRDVFAFLWLDEEPQTSGGLPDRLFECHRRRYAEFDAGKEMRSIARIVAWCLTGEAIHDPTQTLRFGAEVWAPIRRALIAGTDSADAIESPRRLAEEMRLPGLEPKLHFLSPTATKQKRKGSVLKSIIGLLLTSSVIAIAGLFIINPPWPPGKGSGGGDPPPQVPVCETCPDLSAESKIHAELIAFERKQASFNQALGYSDDEFNKKTLQKVLGEAKFRETVEAQLQTLTEMIDDLDRAHQASSGTEADVACLALADNKTIACLGRLLDFVYVGTNEKIPKDGLNTGRRFIELASQYEQNAFFLPLTENSTWKENWESKYSKLKRSSQ